MTIIASFLTEDFGFLVGDTRLSIKSKDGGPTKATIKTDTGNTINITAQKGINVDGNSKIYDYNQKYYFGGSGDYNKIIQFANKVFTDKPSDLLDYTYDYYNKNNTPPESLQIMFFDNTDNKFHSIAYNHTVNDQITYFNKYSLYSTPDKIRFLVIGSGSQTCTPIFKKTEKDLTDKYLQAKANNSIEEFKEYFTNFIKEIISDIAKYDDTISAKTFSICIKR